MRKYIFALALLSVLQSGAVLLAQEDEEPYLFDEDMDSIELILPEDVPERLREAPEQKPIAPPVYHLLILDRMACPSSDIGDPEDISVLYKFRHGANGYLIVAYSSPGGMPAFPALPPGSRIVAHFMSAYRGTMRGYAQSSVFRRHVTNPAVLAGILGAL